MNWIQQYLQNFRPSTQQGGLIYFKDGRVHAPVKAKHEEKYTATVTGNWDYEVTIDHDPKSDKVSAYCSCPVGSMCKHIYATLLAIEARSPAPEQESPLAQAISAAGIKMKGKEHAYLDMLQQTWQSVRRGRSLSEYDIPRFSPGAPSGYRDWNPFPERPDTDLRMWRYIALDLRRRKLQIPAFLAPITEDPETRRRYETALRQKEIEDFRELLDRAAGRPLVAAAREPVDLRLMLRRDEARLQFSETSQPNFKDLKKNNFEGLWNEEHGPRVVPEALALLNLANDSDQPEVSYKFSYWDDYDLALLGKFLRTPSLASRIVDEKGKPLKRASERLIYKLEDPVDAQGDYRLSLQTETGSPTPEIYAIMPGAPNLYLTSRGLYEGPPEQSLSERSEVLIPAEALEGPEGFRFLQSIGIAAPPRIQEKITTVVPVVAVSARISTISPYSSQEYAFVSVTSHAPGRRQLILSPEGWIETNRYAEPAGQRKRSSKIVMEDQRVMEAMLPGVSRLNGAWDPYKSCLRIKLNKTFPENFHAWVKSLPEGVEIELDEELNTLLKGPVAGSVALQIEEAGVDWFDLKVSLKVADLNLTKEELRLLLNAKGGFVRLGSKGWRRLEFNVSEEQSAQLSDIGVGTGDFSAEPQRLHALQLATPSAKALLPEPQYQRIQKRVEEIQLRVAPEVPKEITAELRPYQVQGFHFLAYLAANSFGGVLADDMGLGKTLQALSLLCWARKQNTPGSTLPALIVCPKSVMDNWKSEATRFWPGLRVRLWRGEPAEELPAARQSIDLLVANYSQMRSLSPAISELDWFAVILDEAQYIKNPDSQTAQIARTLKSTYRLALTGTPIENRLLDLWSIFQFCMPGVLGNRAHFLRSFNQKEDPLARRRLSARVRPFLLRRTKGQVAKDLPAKTEEDLACEMEGKQLTLYKAELKAAQQRLLGIRSQKELNEQRFHFLTSLLRLRQICCHPGLISDEAMKAPSAKLEALEDLLEPLMEEGHKVLVFSQFTSMLGILRTFLEERKWKHYYLAGETENRGELVTQFQAVKGAAVFLISLKAGGFGLNLTAASYVVLFDPWWNPAVETQAIDRTHRIGQTSHVMAYRLLVKDSIEQKIRLLQKTKAALAEDVLGEERFSESLSLDDLKTLFES